MSVSRVVRSVVSLDAADLRAFVVALWTARGYDARIAGERVVVDDGTRTRTIAVAPGSRLPGVGPRLPDAVRTGGVDLVVAGGDPARLRGRTDAGVVGPRDLHSMINYAVDPGDRDRLLADYLGLDPDATGRRREPATPVGDRVRRALPSRGRAYLLVAVAAVVVLTAGLFAPGGVANPLATGGGSADVDVDVREEFDVTTAATATATADGGDADDGLSPGRSYLAPGVSSRGIDDLDRLLAAHREYLGDDSYTLVLAYEERVDGTVTASVRKTVRVEGPGRYVAVVNTSGNVTSNGGPVDPVEAYANGTYRWENRGIGAGDVFVRGRVYATAPDFYTRQTVRYLEWFLDANETSVAGQIQSDRTNYHFVSVADERRDYAATVVVTERGFVRRLQADYDVVGRDREATFLVQYAEVGSTTSGEPDWLGDAKNVTADR